MKVNRALVMPAPLKRLFKRDKGVAALENTLGQERYFVQRLPRRSTSSANQCEGRQHCDEQRSHVSPDVGAVREPPWQFNGFSLSDSHFMGLLTMYSLARDNSTSLLMTRS